MNIGELEQKYSNLETRVSKIERFLRDTSKKHARLRQLIRESKEESSQGIETHIPQEDLGD